MVCLLNVVNSQIWMQQLTSQFWDEEVFNEWSLRRLQSIATSLCNAHFRNEFMEVQNDLITLFIKK